MRSRISVSLLLLCLFSLAAKPQKAKGNPWIGNWKLDAARSTVHQDAAPVREIHIIAADRSAIRYTIIGGSDATPFLESYDGKADGHPHPLLIEGNEVGTVSYQWRSGKVASSEIAYPDGSKYSQDVELSKDLKTLILKIHPLTGGHGEIEQTLVCTKE